MPDSYTKCKYINPDNQECDKFFKFIEGRDNDFCEYHKEKEAFGHDIEKNEFDLVKESRALCSEMNLDELSVHIRGLEMRMQSLKTEMLTARALKAEKLDALNEEDRKEYVKKVQRQESGLAPKKEKTKNLTKSMSSDEKFEVMKKKFPAFSDELIWSMLGVSK